MQVDFAFHVSLQMFFACITFTEKRWYQNWFEEIEPIIYVWNIPSRKTELKRSIFHWNDTKKVLFPLRSGPNFRQLFEKSKPVA